jgi:hypothetical protein
MKILDIKCSYAYSITPEDLQKLRKHYPFISDRYKDNDDFECALVSEFAMGAVRYLSVLPSEANIKDSDLSVELFRRQRAIPPDAEQVKPVLASEVNVAIPN